MTRRLAVLISGSGTNLQALIDAIATRILNAEIVLVVSNRKSAFGLKRAEAVNIPTLYFPLKPYIDAGRSRADCDADLAAQIAPYQPDLIVLAGWMHIFSSAFLDHFPRSVVNLHPALPGQFAGVNAIERAYRAWLAGDLSESGCMVHYVIPEVDAGDVIAQEIVPFEAGDTLEAYEVRLHQAEHRLIVSAVKKALESL